MFTADSKNRKLERTVHLENSVKDFFQNVLGLSEVQFDEAKRINHDVDDNEEDATGEGDNGGGKHKNNDAKPVLIKFPSIRIKTAVLKASRELPAPMRRRYSVGEDFTETVKLHRRKLVAFARKRSRVTKRKWALKYDSLYMNGRVFVFNEEKNRVVPKNKMDI